MDPYDLPTVLTLSAITDLEEPTDAEFDAALQNELVDQAYRLPLQDLCTYGGSPERGDVEIYDFRVNERTDDHVRGTFSVSFTESYQSGCRDIILHEPQGGALNFEFERDTNQISIELSHILPSRETEEF